MSSNILSILNELQNHPSTIQKQEILKKNKSDLLKRVLRLAYDSTESFYLKKIPSYSSMNTSSIDYILDNALDFLEHVLARRIVTGNAAIDNMIHILSGMHQDDAEVITRVLARDLKCGINTKLINKVFPGLISEMEVMLADSDISRITFPAIAQPKLDGSRVHITRIGNTIKILSRNGKLVNDLGYLKDSALVLMEDGETWDGEIVCVEPHDPSKNMDRKKSNGIFNKSIKDTITDKEATLMRFHTWDIIDRVSPYSMRLWKLRERFDSTSHIPSLKFYPVLGKIVNNQEEAMEMYEEEITKGEEGIILKNMNSKWVGKRSKDLCKIKEIQDCDLRCIGWEYGTGKNSNRMGNLIFGTDDGELVVSVGTGYSDKDRDDFTEDYVIDKIGTIQFNQIIKAKVTGSKYSLFLPRFVEFREDKDTTNSLKEILK